MTKLTGTFECKIDNKGRILLPSQLKKQLDGILKNTPEAIFLDTLNSIYREIDRNTLSNSELENAITLLESPGKPL